jgi:uncharacterized membrane protein YhaH (DUF805 family)
MGSFGPIHIIIILLCFLVIFPVVLIPISKILRRAGWSGWLCLLYLIPIANLILLWVFAFGDWPTLPEKSN